MIVWDEGKNARPNLARDAVNTTCQHASGLLLAANRRSEGFSTLQCNRSYPWELNDEVREIIWHAASLERGALAEVAIPACILVLETRLECHGVAGSSFSTP